MSWRRRAKTWLANQIADVARDVIARVTSAPIPTTIFEQRRQDHELRRTWKADIAADANPLLRAGEKHFSQFDEDGILRAILARLPQGSRTFLEIGVGNGTENNTIALLASGWRGQWIGAEDLAWAPSGMRLSFTKSFVTVDNVASLVRQRDCDVFSLDIDGNDYWVAEAVLPTIQPRIVVVEYNGKFAADVRFVMPYDAAHKWRGDDYFGVSLLSWVELLAPAGYRLVCCSYMGTNAFFVREAEATGRFDDVPSSPSVLHRPALYVDPFRTGHPTSGRTVATLERQVPSDASDGFELQSDRQEI